MMLRNFIFASLLGVCVGKSQNGYQAYYNPNYYTAYDLETCNSVIQVTNIENSCDSPYTYYYGNGVNRNSLTCKYGDKISLTVDFDVLEDIYDADVYVKIQVEAYQDGDVIVSTNPKQLVRYVENDVNQAGSYTMYYTASLGDSSGNSGETTFTPYVKIAFSSQQDGGYNLGAANIGCDDYTDDSSSNVWATEARNMNDPADFKSVVAKYGILILTVLAIAAFGSYLYGRLNEKISPGHSPLLGSDNLLGGESPDGKNVDGATPATPTKDDDTVTSDYHDMKDNDQQQQEDKSPATPQPATPSEPVTPV